MCELYILLAFGLGLFSGWMINFLLAGKYVEKAVNSYYSKEQKEEIKEAVQKENRNFKISTLFWVVFLFAVFVFLIYLSKNSVPQRHEASGALEKADNEQVFGTIVDTMKDFSR